MQIVQANPATPESFLRGAISARIQNTRVMAVACRVSKSPVGVQRLQLQPWHRGLQRSSWASLSIYFNLLWLLEYGRVPVSPFQLDLNCYHGCEAGVKSEICFQVIWNPCVAIPMSGNAPLVILVIPYSYHFMIFHSCTTIIIYINWYSMRFIDFGLQHPTELWKK